MSREDAEDEVSAATVTSSCAKGDERAAVIAIRKAVLDSFSKKFGGGEEQALKLFGRFIAFESKYGWHLKSWIEPRFGRFYRVTPLQQSDLDYRTLENHLSRFSGSVFYQMVSNAATIICEAAAKLHYPNLSYPPYKICALLLHMLENIVASTPSDDLNNQLEMAIEWLETFSHNNFVESYYGNSTRHGGRSGFQAQLKKVKKIFEQMRVLSEEELDSQSLSIAYAEYGRAHKAAAVEYASSLVYFVSNRLICVDPRTGAPSTTPIRLSRLYRANMNSRGEFIAHLGPENERYERKFASTVMGKLFLYYQHCIRQIDAGTAVNNRFLSAFQELSSVRKFRDMAAYILEVPKKTLPWAFGGSGVWPGFDERSRQNLRTRDNLEVHGENMPFHVLRRMGYCLEQYKLGRQYSQFSEIAAARGNNYVRFNRLAQWRLESMNKLGAALVTKSKDCASLCEGFRELVVDPVPAAQTAFHGNAQQYQDRMARADTIMQAVQQNNRRIKGRLQRMDDDYRRKEREQAKVWYRETLQMADDMRRFGILSDQNHRDAMANDFGVTNEAADDVTSSSDRVHAGLSLPGGLFTVTLNRLRHGNCSTMKAMEQDLRVDQVFIDSYFMHKKGLRDFARYYRGLRHNNRLTGLFPLLAAIHACRSAVNDGLAEFQCLDAADYSVFKVSHRGRNQVGHFELRPSVELIARNDQAEVIRIDYQDIQRYLSLSFHQVVTATDISKIKSLLGRFLSDSTANLSLIGLKKLTPDMAPNDQGRYLQHIRNQFWQQLVMVEEAHQWFMDLFEKVNAVSQQVSQNQIVSADMWHEVDEHMQIDSGNPLMSGGVANLNKLVARMEKWLLNAQDLRAQQYDMLFDEWHKETRPSRTNFDRACNCLTAKINSIKSRLIRSRNRHTSKVDVTIKDIKRTIANQHKPFHIHVADDFTQLDETDYKVRNISLLNGKGVADRSVRFGLSHCRAELNQAIEQHSTLLALPGAQRALFESLLDCRCYQKLRSKLQDRQNDYYANYARRVEDGHYKSANYLMTGFSKVNVFQAFFNELMHKIITALIDDATGQPGDWTSVDEMLGGTMALEQTAECETFLRNESFVYQVPLLTETNQFIETSFNCAVHRHSMHGGIESVNRFHLKARRGLPATSQLFIGFAHSLRSVIEEYKQQIGYIEQRVVSTETT